MWDQEIFFIFLLRLAIFLHPIYSLNNDPACVLDLKSILNKENIYFGVPDVITSLTASSKNLAIDPLSLHTENGVLYLEDHGDIEDRIKEATPSIEWIDLDQREARMGCEAFSS